MRLTAIVLAAGAGRRFGGDKMAADFRGEPLLFHAIRAARAAPVDQVMVVCPPHLEIGAWADGPQVLKIAIDSPALSLSLQAGLVHAAGHDGAFVFLGDMPLIPHEVAPVLAAAIGNSFAAVPRHGGQPGHPVLFAARAFPELAALAGDRGAGTLIGSRSDIAWVDWPSDAVLLDIDRQEDLARLHGRGSIKT